MLSAPVFINTEPRTALLSVFVSSLEEQSLVISVESVVPGWSVIVASCSAVSVSQLITGSTAVLSSNVGLYSCIWWTGCNIHILFPNCARQRSISFHLIWQGPFTRKTKVILKIRQWMPSLCCQRETSLMSQCVKFRDGLANYDVTFNELFLFCTYLDLIEPKHWGVITVARDLLRRVNIRFRPNIQSLERFTCDEFIFSPVFRWCYL